ncbi:MAG: ribonuclease H-like domain-containing protein [Patescibacteria group bacterium]
MPRIIFDIETVGVDFTTLDPTSQESLLRYAQTDEEEKELKSQLGFSPLTGEIVAIGILNPDTDRGAVYFQAPDSPALAAREESNVQYTPVPNEKELLRQFWQVMSHYDQFVTFNGRAFDGPYLIIRSAIRKIKPTVNLMPNRYYDTHIDLLDRLTFFGAVRRKMNLHMWCKAFGIESPKDKGVTGDDVAQLFKDKRYEDIARYCYDDVRATKELFFAWDKYINIK